MPRCARGRQSAFANPVGATTDAPVVAAVANKRIRVLGFCLSPAAATPPASVVFNSKPGGPGTAVSATFGLVAGVPVSMPSGGGQGDGLFETNIGEGLSVTTGAGANAVGVQVVYEEISGAT